MNLGPPRDSPVPFDDGLRERETDAAFALLGCALGGEALRIRW